MFIDECVEIANAIIKQPKPSHQHDMYAEAIRMLENWGRYYRSKTGCYYPAVSPLYKIECKSIEYSEDDAEVIERILRELKKSNQHADTDKFNVLNLYYYGQHITNNCDMILNVTLRDIANILDITKSTVDRIKQAAESHVAARLMQIYQYNYLC